MKRNITNFPFIILTGFIILSLINFLLHSSLNPIFAISVVLFVVLLFIGRKRINSMLAAIERINPVFIFIAVGIVGIVSMVLFNPGLWDDTLSYHNQALQDIEDGTVKFNDAYSIRGIFYLIPIYRFFGTSIVIVKLINFTIYLLTGFLIFKVIQLNFDKNSNFANLGTLLFYSIPFFALAINIPHWDLISTFYLMLFLFLFSLIISYIKTGSNYSDLRFWALSFAMGVSAILLFYTRGLSMPMRIALGLFIVLLFLDQNIVFRIKLKLFLFGVGAPLMVYFSFNYLIKQTEIYDKSEVRRSNEQMLFSYNDTRFDGTSGHKDKKWVYFPQLPKHLHFTYAVKKLNSEIYYEAPWYLFKLSEKSKEFYTIGGYNEWVLHDNPYRKCYDIVFSYWESILRVVINLLALLGVFLYFTGKKKGNIFLLFTASFIFTSTFFGLFNEANSRYSLIFVFGLIIFALIGLEGLVNREFQSNISVIKNGLLKLMVVMVIFLAVFFGYRTFIAKTYSFEQLQEVNWRKNIGQINYAAFQKSITPGEEVIMLTKPAGRNTLSFFLRMDKNALDSLHCSISDGLTTKTLSFEENNFEPLQTDGNTVAGFFEISLNDFKETKLLLNFSRSDMEKPFIVEYVSFNK